MIRVEGLTKCFGRFTALDNLTMTVPPGAVYGLVGPNGAGKSTLIRHVAGAYRPTAGFVTVDGVPVYEHPEVKARIGLIPDDYYYFPSATVEDMMRYNRRLYPRFSLDRYRKLRECFPRLRENMPIRRMSKGMQKQAALWLTLSGMPDLLILDEPVDGLDPVMRRQMWALMKQDVRERGLTVLVSSHNLRELEDVCGHVGVLSHGRLLLERTLSELQDNVVKMQVVFDGPPPGLPADMEVIHTSSVGRIFTYIIRGNAADVTNRMATLGPLFMEALPLTLEEIFVYELGGDDYAVRELVL